MADSPALNLRVVASLSAIKADDWDRCANPPTLAYNPFVKHDFLLAMETSGSATAETGWLGQHLALEDGAGQVLGVMPLSLNDHSQGE